jgi:hypothetical protein
MHQNSAVAIRRLISALRGRNGYREILHLRWEHVDFERGLLLLTDNKISKKAIVLNAPALSVLANVPRVGSIVIAGQAASTDNEQPWSDLKRPWGTGREARSPGRRSHSRSSHTHASVGAGAS